jgi:hypothetical protein
MKRFISRPYFDGYVFDSPALGVTNRALNGAAGFFFSGLSKNGYDHEQPTRKGRQASDLIAEAFNSHELVQLDLG